MNLNWRHKAGLFLAVTATGIGLLLELSAKQTAGIALLGIAFAWLVGSFSTRTFALVLLLLIALLGFYLAGEPVWVDWQTFSESVKEYDSAIADVQLAVKEGKRVGGLDLASGLVPPLPAGAKLDVRVEATKAAEKWMRAVKMADPQGTLRWVPLNEVEAAEKTGGTVKDDWFARRIDWFDPYAKYGGSVDYGALAKQYGAIRSTPPPGFIPESTPAFNLFFPNDMSDSEIIRVFETEILRPRPAFSLATALASHRWLFLIGLTLFVSSLLGFIWLLRHGRKTSQASA